MGARQCEVASRRARAGLYPCGPKLGANGSRRGCLTFRGLLRLKSRFHLFSHIPSMPKVSAATPNTNETSTVVALPESYEAAMAELEQLVGRLESGELPLEHMLAGYQRGAVLLQFCRDKLQAVEEQVKLLDDGVLKPWKAQ